MRKKFTKASNNPSNTVQRLANFLATLLAIPSRTAAPKTQPSQMNLHGPNGGRKYLNAAERRRFYEIVASAGTEERLFCLTLIWTGSRISEALALTPAAIDLDAGSATLESLKKRRRGVNRQVPLPPTLLEELDATFDLRGAQRDPFRCDRRIWRWSRSKAWRRVKTIMEAAAVPKTAAMPKGLRHTFGVVAFQSVPPHLVQRWLGHSSLRTTAIYGEVSGQDEKLFADRLWKAW